MVGHAQLEQFDHQLIHLGLTDESMNSPLRHRANSSLAGLVGLLLKNAEMKTLVSKTALMVSVTLPFSLESNACSDGLIKDLLERPVEIIPHIIV